MSATASQLRATAGFHDRLAAAQARFSVGKRDAKRHSEDAAKLRKAAERKEKDDRRAVR